MTISSSNSNIDNDCISYFWFYLSSETKNFQGSFSMTVYYILCFQKGDPQSNCVQNPPKPKLVSVSLFLSHSLLPTVKMQETAETATCEGVVGVEGVWDRWCQAWWDANGCVKCLHMANSQLSINLESWEMVKPILHDGKEERKRWMGGKEEESGDREFVKKRRKRRQKLAWGRLSCRMTYYYCNTLYNEWY